MVTVQVTAVLDVSSIFTMWVAMFLNCGGCCCEVMSCTMGFWAVVNVFAVYVMVDCGRFRVYYVSVQHLR